MDAITKFFTDVLAPVINTGPIVLIFIIFTIIGIIVRLKVIDAFRNGLMIAVGFSGVYLIVDYFLSNVGPVAGKLAQKFAGGFAYTDVGWAPFSGIAWGAPVAFMVVGIAIIVNLIMIFLNMTDTLNLNFWDYWHAILGTAIVVFITGNLLAGIIFAILCIWLSLMFADWYANLGHVKYFGFQNISFYQGCMGIWGVIGEGLARVMNLIPFLRKSNVTSESIQERFGAIGEPAVLGAIIGFLMGLAAGLPLDQLLIFTLEVAAALVLLPRMTGIVMEAIVPVMDAAAAFMQKRVKGRALYIGVDPAIAVGNTTAMTVTIIMMPILIFLNLVLPFAKAIPIADNVGLIFVFIYLVAPMKGDLLKTLISALIISIIGIFSSIVAAPILTQIAIAQGVSIPAGASGITSWAVHMDLETFLSWAATRNYVFPNLIGIAVLTVIVIGFSAYLRIRFVQKRKGGLQLESEPKPVDPEN